MKFYSLKSTAAYCALFVVMSVTALSSAPLSDADQKGVQLKNGWLFSIGIWQGWNIPTGNELKVLDQVSDYCKSYSAVTSGFTTLCAGSNSKDEITIGANFLAGTKYVRAGIGLTYLSIYRGILTFYGTNGTSSQDTTASSVLKFLPLEAVIRISPFAGLGPIAGGFYVGGFGGYALSLSAVESKCTGYNLVYCAAGVRSTTTIDEGKGAISFGGSVGYVISIGGIGIELGVDVRVLSGASGDKSFVTNRTLPFTVSNNGSTSLLNITPHIGLTYTFGGTGE